MHYYKVIFVPIRHTSGGNISLSKNYLVENGHLLKSNGAHAAVDNKNYKSCAAKVLDNFIYRQIHLL